MKQNTGFPQHPEFPDPQLPGRYNGEYIPERPGYRYARDEDRADLKHLMYELWHHKWLIMAFVMAGLIGAWIYSAWKMPVFKADGSMQISSAGGSNALGAGDNLSSFLQSNYGFGMNSTIDNEIQVLRSRTFTFEVAERIFAEKYEPSGRLFPLLWADYPRDSSHVDVNAVYARLKDNIDVQRADRTSDLVRLSYESPSPQEAARVVDLAIQTYSDVSVRMNRSQARSALDFLTGEMERVNIDLDDAESNLQGFMNEQKLVKLDEQASELITAVSTLQAERQAAEIKLTSVISSLRTYRAEMENLAPGLPEQLTESVAPRLAQLQYALADMETQKVLLLSRNPNMAENEPALRDLNNQISSIRNEISEIAGNLVGRSDAYLGFVGSTDGNLAQQFARMREQILNLEMEESQLTAMLELFDRRLRDYDRQFNAIPDNMMELARRQRDLEINEKLYMLIAQQAAETALWEQTQTGLGRVVDLAEVPSFAIRPRKQLVYLIGFCLGLGLAVGFIFVRDLVKNEIDSIDKLESKGLPILAVVPDFGQHFKKHFEKGADQHLVVRGRTISPELSMVVDSISPVSEAYRRLQGNIVYAHPDRSLKTIVVTSANKGEGKTTVAANLAISLAEAGRKVVVLDADFRRPRVHSIFGATRSPGLIETLFGDLPLDQAIQTSVVTHVKLLTTGKIPPNPVEISRSAKLRDVILELKEQFDHIIIDSPPFGIIADAAGLIAQSDGVLLVCRFDKTKESEFDFVTENLRKVRANVIGVAMTAFDPDKASGSGYSNQFYKYNYESYEHYESQ